VILVEDALLRVGRGIVSFAEFFYEALHHFTAVLDSLAGGFCAWSLWRRRCWGQG
jgi:hypothetical protein